MATASSPRQMSGDICSPTWQSRPSALSPWNQIVRGSESETIADAAFSGTSSPQSRAATEQTASDSPFAAMSASSSPPSEGEKSDNGGEAHGNTGKKPAWNRPFNGAVEVGPVMGAASWPALSESTKSPWIKSSSSSSVPVSQVAATASAATLKHGNGTNFNSRQSHSHQRSFNKRSGPASSANGSLTHPSPQGSAVEGPLSSSSSRGHNQRNGFLSQSYGGNDNQHQRNSFRSQNGNHHQNHGGKRNQVHGNNNWSHRNFSGRDGNMQPHRDTGFMRNQGLTIPLQFVQPMQPFGNPVGYPEVASPIYYGPLPVPFLAPIPAPFFYQVQDLYLRLIDQIDFYFSDANLIKDIFLRQNMDEQGYVKIQLIAGFKKVSALTDNIQLILEALQNSSVVEVQGEKIRRRNNWKNWLIPPTVQLPTVSSPRPWERSDQNAVTTRIQNLSLEQDATDQSGSSHQLDVLSQASTSRSSSDDSKAQPLQSSDDATECQVCKSAGFASLPNSD